MDKCRNEIRLATGAPGWLSQKSMRLLGLGIMSSSPTLNVQITKINKETLKKIGHKLN